MTIKLIIENNKGEQKEFIPKFYPYQEVYYVFKKFRKICIVKTQISSIAFTNIWNYRK